TSGRTGRYPSRVTSSMTSGSRSLRAAALGAAFLLILAAFVSDPASAQQGEGRIAGRVSDDQTGAGVEGVTVVLNYPSSPDGGAPHQELLETDSDGKYAFASVQAGRGRPAPHNAGEWCHPA